MELSDFKVGATYQMTIVPYLDCEAGEEKVRQYTVLESATAENSRIDDGVEVSVPPPSVLEDWAKFLRVRDADGRVRLQWPSLVVRAIELPAQTQP